MNDIDFWDTGNAFYLFAVIQTHLISLRLIR